jgi:hypothetical protein
MQMNRQEFINLLSRLVADKELTEEQAKALVAQFDNGTLPDEWQLPLPADKAIRGRKEENEAVAVMLLLLLLSRHQTMLRPGMSYYTAERMASQVQDAFAMRALAYAGLLVNGEHDLSDWHADMLDAIEQHIIQHMMLGNGQASLSKEQQAELDTIMLEQSAFLSRFADHNALTVGLGGALLVALLASRSELYGGVGRGSFFRSLEAAGVARGDLGDGWVLEFLAVDDKSTCSPCLNAQGFYLPGTDHPRPGIICLGRARCRCQLIPRYLPNEYARLTGA